VVVEEERGRGSLQRRKQLVEHGQKVDAQKRSYPPAMILSPMPLVDDLPIQYCNARLLASLLGREAVCMLLLVDFQGM
jgi:hypothetical protein